MPTEFGLEDYNGEELYICEAINPYALTNGTLQECNSIEYYLICTADEYIACITLCYEGGNIQSACLDSYVADVMNTTTIGDAIQIVAYNGNLCVKTENNKAEVYNINTTELSVVNEETDTKSEFKNLIIRSKLAGISSNTILPRSTKILNVPYVPQEGNTCWAAAGAAFGRYYTGNRYAGLSASDLATIMGVNISDGAGMGTTLTMLQQVFGINTVHCASRLSNNTAINLFQQAKPIIAGFLPVDGSLIEVGHMVVLCGFNDHNTGSAITYYVRDSNFESLKIVVDYSDEDLCMDYYTGSIFTWEESAYYTSA